MPLLEKVIEDYVVLYAEGLNYLHFKLNGVGSPGKPDQLFISPKGIAFFVEFKRLGEPLRPLQWYWAKQIAMRKCVVYRCDSKVHGERIIQTHLDPSAVPIEGHITYDVARQCWVISGPRDGKDVHVLDVLPDFEAQRFSFKGFGDSST